MSTVYSVCPPDVELLAAQLIERYHPDLFANEVTIEYIFAANENGSALKHNGYPAHGIARIIGLKDRAKGMKDGEISLDMEAWKEMNIKERSALLDHELHHFVVKHDHHTQAVKRDDLNRPLLGMRKHDRQFGFFDVIAARWKKSSSEVQQCAAFIDQVGQLYFPAFGVGGKGNLSKEFIETGKPDDRKVVEFEGEDSQLASVTISGAGTTVITNTKVAKMVEAVGK